MGLNVLPAVRDVHCLEDSHYNKNLKLFWKNYFLSKFDFIVLYCAPKGYVSVYWVVWEILMA